MPAPCSLPLYNNNLKSLGHYSQPVFMLVFQIYEVFICLFRTEKGFNAMLKNLNLPSWQLGRQVMSSRDSSGLMTGIVPLQGSSSESQFQLSVSMKGVSFFTGCFMYLEQRLALKEYTYIWYVFFTDYF